MDEDELNVKLHGKEIGSLEAKLCILGLKIGIFKANLNEEEIENYVKWEDDKKRKNENARKIIKEDVFKELTEREYLIEELENQIKSTKDKKNKIYCKEHGHKEKKGSAYTSPGINEAITHYTCARCGMPYEKKPIITNPFRG